MRKHRAFTLIEVLIVVYIIALLLVVVRPGLMLAGEQAKRAVCAVNLHHIGQALDKYAQDNTGLIPPQWLGHEAGSSPLAPREGYEMFPNHDTSLQFRAYYPAYPDKPLQLAKLYAGGYVTQPLSVLYCPGISVGSSSFVGFLPSNYYQPGVAWSESWFNGGVRYGYSFYTHCRSKLDNLTQEPIVFDVVHTWASIPHKSNGKPTGLNAVFGDGHVKFNQDPAIFADELWDGPAHLYSPAQIGTWYQIVDRITP